MKIWVNTIVHNEENFIWYAVMSVIDHVDKVLIWDTGSTDNTVNIIKEIIKKKGSKVDFKEIGEVSKYDIAKVRQDMLEESNCDWILVLDGDEVWSEGSLRRVIETIEKEGSELDAIVVPFCNLVGDIFHCQTENAGRYNILGKTGHLQIRAINKHIKGLHVKGVYPLEGFYNSDGDILQESKRLTFVNAPYLHATHLQRSGQGRKYRKYKYDLGRRFPKNYKFPEVFYQVPPSLVPSPWVRRSFNFTLISALRFPIVFLKRNFFMKYIEPIFE